MITFLESRRVAFADTFAPFFCSSVGAHLFNLVNQQNPILYQFGDIANTRLHIMFIAPPAFSKTLFIKRQFLGQYGVFGQTHIRTKFVGILTEAAFVGSKFLVDGEIKESPGLAKKFSDGILGCEEFSAILQAMTADYNKGLESVLLSALDQGAVEKSLAGIDISYTTNVTLWAGIQPAKWDPGAGLPRRFLILIHGGAKEAHEIKRRFWQGLNVPPKIDSLTYFWTYVQNLSEKIKSIKRVEFDKELEFRLRAVSNTDITVFLNMCLGYTVIQGNFTDTLVVKMDPMLSEMVEIEMRMRKQMRMGPQEAVIVKIVADHEQISYHDLVSMLLEFSYKMIEIRTLVAELIRQGRLKQVGDKIMLGGV